ncbi:hypothetical protein GGI24_002972 [Coemansia furcata]|nr:hypothetical protein GGI24_002972 [Coemansia furcata]
MAFDINGSWSNTTGPNAPLEHLRNRGMQLSYTQAVDQWLAAKWPAEKLIAGVSFHGRSLTTRDVVTAKEGAEMYVPFDKDVPQGDAEDSFWYDVCENVNSMSGVWQYRHLRDQGILKTTNTTGDEWVRVWDEKSSTPWLYNPPMRRFISYDDQASIDRKVDYAKKKNLKGMMAWSLHSDYNSELISALDNIGPLCRGPKTDTDNVTVTTSSATTTSIWSPTAPFANLPTLPSPTLSSTSASSSGTSATLSTSESASQSTSNTATESSASSASSSSSGKIITFNDVGAPILVVNGVSTPLPSDLAEKIMKVAEKTTSASTLSANATDTALSASGQATGSSESPSAAATASTSDGNNSALTSRTDDALPLGPIAIPIVDSAERARLSQLLPTTTHGPSRPAWNIATNLFDSPLTTSKTTAALPHDIFLGLLTSSSTSADPLSASSSTEATPAGGGGFAATFFLSLDTNSQSGGLKTTTVVPLSQLIASAKSEASLGLSKSDSQGPLDPLSPLISSSVSQSSSEYASILSSSTVTAISTTESPLSASGSITL